MPEFVPLAAYSRDRSNAVGFQFEFICGRCGNAYMSSFRSLSSLSADAGGTAINLAVILGHSATAQIRRSQGALGGSGMAVTGLVLGYIALVLSVQLTIIGVLILAVLSSHLPPIALPTMTP